MQSRRVITDHEKRVVAYHEAGHALCSELLASVEKVHRISIIPRGRALGYTLNLPEEDRYLKTKEELLDYMVVLLGGRVTEQLVFGEITTGASDDLRKVHEISRSMVNEYGMGTELMSKQVPTDDYSMSDYTRRQVDEEQQCLDRPGAPARAQDGEREPPAARGRSRTRCSRTRCSSATDIERHRGGLPRRRRRRRLERPLGRVVPDAPSPARPASPRRSASTSDEPGDDRRLVRPCSDGSITSESRSRISTRPSRSTASGSACRSSTARRWRSRASRRCCSASATSHVELLRPLGPDTAVGKFLERSGPGLHHMAYGTDDIEPRSTQCATPGCG